MKQSMTLKITSILSALVLVSHGAKPVTVIQPDDRELARHGISIETNITNQADFYKIRINSKIKTNVSLSRINEQLPYVTMDIPTNRDNIIYVQLAKNENAEVSVLFYDGKEESDMMASRIIKIPLGKNPKPGK